MAQERNEEISAQLTARLTDLQTRVEALEYRTRGQRGIWIERAMYWLIILGLIIAVILFAAAG